MADILFNTAKEAVDFLCAEENYNHNFTIAELRDILRSTSGAVDNPNGKTYLLYNGPSTAGQTGLVRDASNAYVEIKNLFQ
jgi:hypothetical protein